MEDITTEVATIDEIITEVVTTEETKEELVKRLLCLNRIYYNRQCEPVEYNDADFSIENKRVTSDTVNGFWVSTVFLVIDHAFRFILSEKHEPVLFETMVFKGGDGACEDCQWRYCTEEEALYGHKKIVEHILKNGTIDPNFDF